MYVSPSSRLVCLNRLRNLRLHRDVERGGRLVRQHQGRAQDDRARNRRPLALPAGELVRIADGEPRIQPHQFERLADARIAVPARADVVHLQRRPQRGADRLARVERRGRVLEHALHAPPHLPQRAPREGGDVAVLEPDSARWSGAGGAGSGEAGWTCPSPIRRRCRGSPPAPRRARRRRPHPPRGGGSAGRCRRSAWRAPRSAPADQAPASSSSQQRALWPASTAMNSGSLVQRSKRRSQRSANRQPSGSS